MKERKRETPGTSRRDCAIGRKRGKEIQRRERRRDRKRERKERGR